MVEVIHEWVTRQSVATPVLYLDFDGTVRKGHAELGRFVNGPEDVEIFPEVPGILRGFKQKGWRLVGVSNQGGVALGYLSEAKCMAGMMRTHELCGKVFDRIMTCVHHPEAADPEYAVCWCRKPRIGLIIQAAQCLAAQYNEYYPPHLGAMVGDLPEDRACAENAGLRFVDAAIWRAGGWRELLSGPTSYVTTEVSKEAQ